MDFLKNWKSHLKCNPIGCFTADDFVIDFPRYSPFSLSCITVCFLRTRTNVVPIKFSIHTGQNPFSDLNITPCPFLPSQILCFLSGPVGKANSPMRFFWPAHIIVVLPSEFLPQLELVLHTLIPFWQPGLVLQPFLPGWNHPINVCRKEKWPQLVLSLSQICPSGLLCTRMSSLRVRILPSPCFPVLRSRILHKLFYLQLGTAAQCLWSQHFGRLKHEDPLRAGVQYKPGQHREITFPWKN